MLRYYQIILTFFFFTSVSIGYSNEVHTVDIEIVQGFIITQASINGQTGNFIFDSGAPGLVIHVKENDKHKPQKNCVSAANEMSCHEVKIKKFNWQHIAIKNTTALMLNLDYLTEATGIHIDGLIGSSIIQNEKILIDYKKHKFTFLPKKSSLTELNFKSKSERVFDIEMQDKLPVISFPLDGHMYKFGIDSGSKSNLLSQEVFDILPAEILLNSEAIDLISADQSVISTIAVEISICQIEQKEQSKGGVCDQ